MDQRILTLEEALNAWCDQDLVRRSKELERYRVLWITDPDRSPTPYEINHCRYWKLRSPLEGEAIGKLLDGTFLADGILLPTTPSFQRQSLNSVRWDLLEIDFPNCSARGCRLEIVDIRVALAETVSAAEREAHADGGKGAGAEEFKHSPNYEMVSLRGLVFILQGYQCQIVRLLHEASRGPFPARSGKKLLEEVGAAGNSIGDLFRRHTNPSWRELIHQPRPGYYQLNLGR